jgi:RNA polymerase sigma factor (TIGR02999 family)
MDSPAVNVTLLLQRARDPQDQEAWEQLYRAVEGELRRAAKAHLPRPGSAEHTLQATVLIDEALVRLLMEADTPYENRKHFYRVASGVMRRILIDHARRQRPGRIEAEHLANLPGAETPGPDEHLQRAERLLALDRALDLLHEKDPEAAEVFELHYFGGLRLSLGETPEEWVIHIPDKRPSVEELAATLGIGRATAFRILDRAKKFLTRELPDEAY